MTLPSELSDARVRRILTQKLLVLHAAGVRHLPRPDLRPPVLAAAPSEPTNSSTTTKDESEMSPRAGAKPLSEPATKVAQALPDAVSTANDRVRQLQVLNDRVKGCQLCSELAGMRTQTVFGVGNPHAKIMFIGEAPGADEDKQGEPFVGRAGQLLDKIIEACKMKREDVYIANILKCRPPGNRTPLPDETANCRGFLDAQIDIVQPEYIVCWGSTAAQNLLGTTESIGKLRQRFFNYGDAKVLCTYHPSYLLRNPAAKKDVWDDMKFFFREQGITL